MDGEGAPGPRGVAVRRRGDRGGNLRAAFRPFLRGGAVGRGRGGGLTHLPSRGDGTWIGRWRRGAFDSVSPQARGRF